MNNGFKFELSFTELLYGVVIGNAIARISSLEASKRNIFILVAIMIAIDDYAFWHLEQTNINYKKPWTSAAMFVTDAIILLSWYSMVIAADSYASVFFLCATVFFVLTTVWEIIFRTIPFKTEFLEMVIFRW